MQNLKIVKSTQVPHLSCGSPMCTATSVTCIRTEQNIKKRPTEVGDAPNGTSTKRLGTNHLQTHNLTFYKVFQSCLFQHHNQSHPPTSHRSEVSSPKVSLIPLPCDAHSSASFPARPTPQSTRNRGRHTPLSQPRFSLLAPPAASHPKASPLPRTRSA